MKEKNSSDDQIISTNKIEKKMVYTKPEIKSEQVSRAGLHVQVCDGSGHFGSKDAAGAGCSPLLS